MAEPFTPDLAELFNKYGSDKDRNGYAQIYHTLFYEKRLNSICMLEIGIGTLIPGVHSSMVGYNLPGYKPGGSLRAWRDFFPKGRIIGADIQLDTQFDDEPRIETYICDSTKPDSVSELMNKISQKPSSENEDSDDQYDADDFKFDIILDDGSHHDMDQIDTLKHFYPYLKEGGIYIIEDIYLGSKVVSMPGIVSAMCQHDPFFFVGVKNNICVIYKQHITSKRLNF